MDKQPIDKRAKIFVAGHLGMVGSAIQRRLLAEGYRNLVLRTRHELDLREPGAVKGFFKAEQPQYVFLAAAKVGGIVANSTYPAEFLRDNLLIQINVIDSAYQSGVLKLVCLGSSCIYPRMAPQPIKEEYLLTGPLEPTNEAYAIAKIAGLKAAQAYWKQYGFNAISLMPTNLYGPNDNFDLDTSHVVPALIRKFHEAKLRGAEDVIVWGSGSPRREFLHVDDLANAALFLLRSYDGAEPINVGTGQDLTIRELAQIIAETGGFRGAISFDTTKPDGTPRKLLDVSRLSELGWKPQIELRKGIADTYDWYRKKGAALFEKVNDEVPVVDLRS